MACNQQPKFDLYVTNVQRVNNSLKQTKDNFEKFLNSFLIQHRLDELYGLVTLVKFSKNAHLHTGNTYYVFVRLEKPQFHQAAALALDGALFRGRPITVSLNDAPSDLAQWSGDKEYYHGEKLKYLRQLAVSTENENESTNANLQNKVYDLEKEIQKLELSESFL